MKITVYGASSGQVKSDYVEAAQALGRCIAQRGHMLINGAGKKGLMAASANACMEAGGTAIGVIPFFMIERKWHHEGMSELMITEDMHERKEKMAQMSNACVALPGGVGTLEELLEIITWKQLGLYLQPIVMLNTNGFFDDLLKQLRHAIDEQFMRSLHGKIWQVAQTPEEAVSLCETTPVWDASIQKFAAL